MACFQNEGDAKRFREEMEMRLTQFHLAIAPEKTKRIEFGVFRTIEGEGPEVKEQAHLIF